MSGDFWSGRWGSNPRPFAWQANALPLCYSRAAQQVIGSARKWQVVKTSLCGPIRLGKQDADPVNRGG